MNNTKKRFLKVFLPLLLALTTIAAALAGCSSSGNGYNEAMPDAADLYYSNKMNVQANKAGTAESNGTSDDKFVENPFIDTSRQNISTFSADVDTASYAFFRKTVTGWQSQKANTQTILSALKKNAAAFRTEEFLNYFRYDASAPGEDRLFGTTVGILPCPWNEKNRLLRLTLQAPATTPSGGNILVFLIDVSGSMSSSDKLPLLKKAFSYLVEQLTDRDRVSIVTYSGKEEVLLRGCSGSDKQTILNAVNSLEAHGATNGEEGLKKAYEIAADWRIADGNNRIIMASDGDLNVGISSASELKAFVEGKRDEGIFLSVLGFGTGNYRDRNMEALADNGNGVYYYIDGESEAQKVFGTDLISTLYTVAKDVKLQLVFDPAYISAYRQIGYENRQLAESDFTDDTKDAGEVGAGHQVTVFYELVLTEEAEKPDAPADAAWMTLKIRYKDADALTSKADPDLLIGAANRVKPDPDTEFMVCVIELTMLLHDSAYLPDSITYASLYAELSSLDLSSYADRAEFRELVKTLAG